MSGRWSTISWRSIRTLPRPRCSSPPRRNARSGSGWGTASCSSPPTNRIAWRNGLPRWTCCPAGGWISAWAKAPARRSCIRSESACATSANAGRKRCAPSPRCSPATHGNSTASTTTFRHATSSPSRSRSRIRRSGSHALTSAPSATRGAGAWARWASVSFPRTRRAPGCIATTIRCCTTRSPWRTIHQPQHRHRQRLHVRRNG